MFSIRSKGILAAALIALQWTQPANSKEPFTENSQTVTQTVMVERAALLGDPAAVKRLDHRLLVAARNVCDELYPLALVYLTHQCVSDTLKEARDDLTHMRYVHSASNGAPRTSMSVLVQAR